MKIIVPSKEDLERVGGKMLVNAKKQEAMAFSQCKGGACGRCHTGGACICKCKKL